ncbi:hypothetical protein TH61_08920 [Rufibacter sp. DG15C]|uniref:acyltransferase n=1 Tax=Rufibacter sp. DG15C TaxID=1379909 RepID=UPI00078E6C75|nr:acyltransferase [Rufibacter sp. DG15C]AMM51268.1 hypothetical protein TH61_08920 [Rufibacter sp. DG15C]
MAFLTEEQLKEAGFKSIGKNVSVSDKASIYNPAYISLGDYTRIDDFCILSAGEGGMDLGRNVHIACYTSLIGKGKISIGDFAGISSRCAIYSSNDDYSGQFMTGPTLPSEFTNVTHKDVTIGKHTIIGASSIVLPGVNIAEGVSIGAFSLITKDCEAFSFYFGIPAKWIKSRSKDLLKLEDEYLSTTKIN